MKFDYKNSTYEERMKKYTEIMNNLGGNFKNVESFKTELNALTDLLLNNEQVLVFTICSITGKFETWLMAVTDNRIIFLHKGLIFGMKHETVDLLNIQTISYNSGIMFASIDIIHGVKKTKVDYVEKSLAQTIINIIQDQINLIKNPKNIEKETDKYEEIEKLYQLKEKGIITEDEFNEEKKKILSK